MKRYLVILAFVFPSLAYADAGPAASDETAVVPVPTDSAGPAAGSVEVPDIPSAVSGATNALRNGDILVMIGFLFAAAVGFLRWLGSLKIKAFDTKLGGLLLASTIAILAALAVPFIDGQPFSFTLLLGALALAWKGAGIHGHIKDFAGYLKK